MPKSYHLHLVSDATGVNVNDLVANASSKMLGADRQDWTDGCGRILGGQEVRIVEPMVQRFARVTSRDAGWDKLNMEVLRLNRDDIWTHETGDVETALVILGGRCRVTSNRGEWAEIGRRETVFDGMPWALYLPRYTEFTLTPLTDSFEVAHAWVPLADLDITEDYPARLIRPEDSKIEIRGGHHATAIRVGAQPRARSPTPTAARARAAR